MSEVKIRQVAHELTMEYLKAMQRITVTTGIQQIAKDYQKIFASFEKALDQ